MKRSYTETFFRHRLLLILPIIVAFVLGAAYGFTQKRQYISIASVWVDAPISTPSTLTDGYSATPPSAIQQSVLTELINTRSFLLDVAARGPDPAYYRTHSPDEVDAALARLAKSVTVSTPGPNVLSVTVKGTAAKHVPLTAQAVLDTFLGTEANTLRQRAAAKASFDKQQVDVAAAALSNAESALHQYSGNNPASASASSDEGRQLLAAVALAQQQYASAQQTYNQDVAGQAHAGDTTMLKVVDQPSRAIAQSKRKPLVFGGAGGLLAGLAISAMALLVLMAGDRSVRRKTDVEQGLSLRVVGSIADMHKRSLLSARTNS